MLPKNLLEACQIANYTPSVEPLTSDRSYDPCRPFAGLTSFPVHRNAHPMPAISG
jgi:hypothetical protein